jgi:hypothetical protein
MGFRSRILHRIALLGMAALVVPAMAEAALKQPISGLVSMGSIAFHRHDDGIPTNSLASLLAHLGIFGGVVINVTWAQLQPGPDRLDTASIDSALAAVRAYNETVPATPLAVTLRVWSGPTAPGWVKSLEGPPVAVQRVFWHQPEETITIPRFWSDAYRTRWAALQRQLAEKYDMEPLIREVSDTSCSSLSDEPFVFPGDPLSLAHLHEAGFTDALFRDCLARSVVDYAGWKTTRIQVTANPFRRTDSGKPKLAPDETGRILTTFRHEFGQRILLSNHAFGVPLQPWIAPIIDQIKALGPPISFQTMAPKGREGLDWEQTIQAAIAAGAGSVEVWAGENVGGFETIDQQQLTKWSRVLRRGVAPE